MREKLFKYRSITKGWGQKIVPFILFLAALPVRAQEVVLSSPLPGTQQSVSGIGPYVKTAFPFFLTVVAGLALVYITWGGILYATSLSSDRKQAGKDHIANALIGLVLAFLAVLILTTINPNLVDLSLPGLQRTATTPGSGGVPGTGNPDGSEAWQCDPNNLVEYGCDTGETCLSVDGIAPYTCEVVSGAFGGGRCERDPNGFPVVPGCEDPLQGQMPDPEALSACPTEAIDICSQVSASCYQSGTGSYKYFICEKEGRDICNFDVRAAIRGVVPEGCTN